jgi:hypothetical protein
LPAARVAPAGDADAAIRFPPTRLTAPRSAARVKRDRGDTVKEDDAVTARTPFWLAAVAGLTLARACLSAAPPEPARLGLTPDQAVSSASHNQQLADAVAAALRQSDQLRHYAIDVACRDGVVELSGLVHDQPQREEALRLVQGVPGVERVHDRLKLAEGVRQVDDVPPPTPLPDAARKGEPTVPPLVGPAAPEPQPMFQAPPSPYALSPPNMPPYAWPTYAPYNNFSRVATPLAYPYNSWPYIGPCYPFPKVPLGWRSVKLEWDDGYWWFSRTATKYDWWRLRYW